MTFLLQITAEDKLSWVEHEKTFITLGPGLLKFILLINVRCIKRLFPPPPPYEVEKK